jgi:proteic killer suppression protein
MEWVLIKAFGNKIASELFHKGQSKSLPRIFWRRAIDLLDVMEAVDNFEDLKEKGFPPNVRLHPLKGLRKGEWAIDIHKTEGWRITFRLESNQFLDVKIEDYH